MRNGKAAGSFEPIDECVLRWAHCVMLDVTDDVIDTCVPFSATITLTIWSNSHGLIFASARLQRACQPKSERLACWRLGESYHNVEMSSSVGSLLHRFIVDVEVLLAAENLAG